MFDWILNQKSTFAFEGNTLPLGFALTINTSTGLEILGIDSFNFFKKNEPDGLPILRATILCNKIFSETPNSIPRIFGILQASCTNAYWGEPASARAKAISFQRPSVLSFISCSILAMSFRISLIWLFNSFMDAGNDLILFSKSVISFSNAVFLFCSVSCLKFSFNPAIFVTASLYSFNDLVIVSSNWNSLCFFPFFPSKVWDNAFISSYFSTHLLLSAQPLKILFIWPAYADSNSDKPLVSPESNWINFLSRLRFWKSITNWIWGVNFLYNNDSGSSSLVVLFNIEGVPSWSTVW